MPGREEIEFFKVVNDEEHLLGSMKDKVRFGIWYYYYISFYNDQLKIYRQVGNIRQI
jgi:hypothetical protein